MYIVIELHRPPIALLCVLRNTKETMTKAKKTLFKSYRTIPSLLSHMPKVFRGYLKAHSYHLITLVQNFPIQFWSPKSRPRRQALTRPDPLSPVNFQQFWYCNKRKCEPQKCQTCSIIKEKTAFTKQWVGTQGERYSKHCRSCESKCEAAKPQRGQNGNSLQKLCQTCRIIKEITAFKKTYDRYSKHCLSCESSK